MRTKSVAGLLIALLLLAGAAIWIRPGSNASGEGSRGAVFGIDEEGRSGSDEGAVRSAVGLQAGAGPLVRGTSDGAHRGGRGFSSGAGQGKGHDGGRQEKSAAT